MDGLEVDAAAPHAPCNVAPLLTVIVIVRLTALLSCGGGGGVKDAERSREQRLQGGEGGARRVRGRGEGCAVSVMRMIAEWQRVRAVWQFARVGCVHSVK